MGKVVSINDKDNSFVLETGTPKEKTLIKFSKQAIYTVEAVDGDKKETEVVDEAETAVNVEPETTDAFENIETATGTKVNGEEVKE